MKRRWLVLLVLGTSLGATAPNVSVAQSTLGSEGGGVVPGKSNTTLKPNSGAGSASSAPETSLSTRGASNGNTRESDTGSQIATLAPFALLLAVFLAGGLYFFVFRKPTTPQGTQTK